MGVDSDDDVDRLFNSAHSSDESAIAESEQTISPGDIIEFYNEVYVKGSKFSYEQVMVTSIVSKEEGYVSTTTAYHMNPNTEVRIIAKLGKDGTYIPFKDSKVLYIKKYNFIDNGYYKGDSCGIRVRANSGEGALYKKVREAANKYISVYKEAVQAQCDDSPLENQNIDEMSEGGVMNDNEYAELMKDSDNQSSISITNDDGMPVVSASLTCDNEVNDNESFNGKLFEGGKQLSNEDITSFFEEQKKHTPILNKASTTNLFMGSRRKHSIMQRRMRRRKRRNSVLQRYYLFKLHLHRIEMEHYSLERSIQAQRRMKPIRVQWVNYCGNMRNVHFRRRFRMTKECFNDLCMTIKKHVGEIEFKSESYLENETLRNSKMSNVIKAMKKSSGGFVCGEVKLAITLRILAGGSYLDVSDIFHIVPTSCFPMFHKTVKEWICDNPIHDIDIRNYLNNEELLKRAAFKFSQSSSGFFSNVIGALDGWLVKIICPPLTQEDIVNQGHYHSRKGFYALNVQVIVDKDKRVLWHSIRSRGGAHDSSAFKSTQLYEYLMQNADKLGKGNYFFVGDSAYSIRNFLMVPYDNAEPNSAEDAFNYYLSTTRIWAECAFGEIDMRWGIFWRKLGFELENTVNIIEAAFRLHNFIIEYRLNKSHDDEKWDNKDFKFFSKECSDFSKTNPDEIVGTFGDNVNEENPSGFKEKREAALQKLGVDKRNVLKNILSNEGLQRVRSNFRRNRNNHVIAE